MTELARLREALEALEAMLKHSCVADSDPKDKDSEDHDAERLARRSITTLRAALAVPASAARPEVEAEAFIQAAVDSSPEPLRRLGEWLTHKLDDDDWKTAERMLLGATLAVPTGGEASRKHAAKLVDVLEGGGDIWCGCPDAGEENEKVILQALREFAASPVPQPDVESMREALKPFAHFADGLIDEMPDDSIVVVARDDGSIVHGPGINVGDLRRARRALSGEKEGQPNA